MSIAGSASPSKRARWSFIDSVTQNLHVSLHVILHINLGVILQISPRQASMSQQLAVIVCWLLFWYWGIVCHMVFIHVILHISLHVIPHTIYQKAALFHPCPGIPRISPSYWLILYPNTPDIQEISRGPKDVPREILTRGSLRPFANH